MSPPHSTSPFALAPGQTSCNLCTSSARVRCPASVASPPPRFHKINHLVPASKKPPFSCAPPAARSLASLAGPPSPPYAPPGTPLPHRVPKGSARKFFFYNSTSPWLCTSLCLAKEGSSCRSAWSSALGTGSCAPLTTRRGHGDMYPTDPLRARRLYFFPSTTLIR